MIAGVYKITCTENGQYYFGSSVNIESRFKNHIAKLKSKKHRNHRLQRIVNKYGIDSLIFEIVQKCNSEDTLICEQYFLNNHSSDDNCINFCKDAKAPMRGLKFSEEHKRKMSESQIRNKYIFTFSNGENKVFNSLKEAGTFFKVKNSIISRWFKRKDLGRKHGLLFQNNVVKAEKIGDEQIILNQYQYKQEPWILNKSTSKTQYYRNKRKQLLAT
jgi:group I intron endonuclease